VYVQSKGRAIERKNRLIDARLTFQPKRSRRKAHISRIDHRVSGTPNFFGGCTTIVVTFCQTLGPIAGGRPDRFPSFRPS
jgi:hypothetical protein